MIEAPFPRVIDFQRASEPHTAIHTNRPAPGKREVEQGQEILVPSHGDAVFRHAAESLENAILEFSVDILPGVNRFGRCVVCPRKSGVEGFDL